MKPTGKQVAANAARKAREGAITYKDQDCQSFVEHCVMDCGGKMAYAGSNDMFRNAGTPIPLAGVPPVGALLFIHDFDGGEPEKYKKDGKGNASHVGLYCGEQGAQVAHSIASKGRVCPSTLKNGWTHYILAKEIDYEGVKPMETYEVTVTASSVNLRKAPGGDYICKIPNGTALTVLNEQNGFGQVIYVKESGWIDLQYTQKTGGATPQPDGEMVTVTLPREALQALVDAAKGVL